MAVRSVVLLLLILIGLPLGPAGAQQVPPTKVPEGERLAPHPRLFLDQPAYEAGEVKAGTSVSHQFTFKNEGDAPLTISEVRAGCGCMVSDFDREVAPGGVGRVTITMKIYQEWAGHSLRRTAWVLTNDPVAPQIRLTMSAKVQPEEAPAPNKP